MNSTLPFISKPQIASRKKYLVERLAASRLSPIDTSFSFHSNSTTATSSSTASAHHIWAPTGRQGFPNLYAPSALSPMQEDSKILASNTLSSPLAQRHIFHPLALSPPLLSARSTAFLTALQHSFLNAIDAYIHRQSTNAPSSSSCQRTHSVLETPGQPIEMPKQKRKQPLSHQRKVAAATCAALILTVITLTAFFASKHMSKRPKAAQHLIMGGSASIVGLAALLMLAAGRSVKEILAMAAVAFTICQCVQQDLSSSF